MNYLNWIPVVIAVLQAIESLKNPEWFIWVQVAGVIIIPIVLSLALLCQNNKNNKNNAPLLYNAGVLILCGTKKLNGHQYIAVNLTSVVDRTSLILNYDLERLKIDPTYVSEVFPKIKAAQTLSLGIPTDLF